MYSGFEVEHSPERLVAVDKLHLEKENLKKAATLTPYH